MDNVDYDTIDLHAPSPEPGAFQPGPETVRLIHDTRKEFQYIASLSTRLGEASEAAKALEQDVAVRLLAMQSAAFGDIDSAAGGLSTIQEQVALLAETSRQTSELVSTPATSVGLIATAFQHLPLIPANHRVLTEIVDSLHRLRALYGQSWDRFDALQDYVRPVRSGLHVLRREHSGIQERLDSVGNEAAAAIYPILSNFYGQVQELIQRMMNTLRDPLIQIVHSLGSSGKLSSEELDTLSHSLIAPLDIELSCDANTPDSGELESPHLHRLRIEVIGLQDRLRRLEHPDGSEAGGQTSTDHGETPSISHLHKIIGDLADRVTNLEDHAHDRVEHVSSSPDSQPDSRMQQYLDSVGLTSEVIKRLVRQSGRTGTAFPFPGHTFGMS